MILQSMVITGWILALCGGLILGFTIGAIFGWWICTCAIRVWIASETRKNKAKAETSSGAGVADPIFKERKQG